jgi:hypothetical protein
MHSHGLFRSLLLGCAALIICPALSASTIYTTGGTPLLFSAVLANAWQIGSTQSFRAVAVSGTGNMVVEIASNVAGKPGTILETITATAPSTPKIVSLQSVLKPTLSAGTTYWLVVTDTGTLDLAWMTGPNVRGVDINIGGNWVASSGSTRGVADILSAPPVTPVPEFPPASMLGFGLCAISMAWRRRA